MPERTIKPTRTQRPIWTDLVTLAVWVLLLTIHSPAPIAHAQEPEPTPTSEAGSKVPPPPGDCWNGVLSDEPLHCHILEEAQRAGHIEVVAMYQVHERRFFEGPLHIYLRQAEPLSSEVGDFLRDKAYEYIEIPEARERYGDVCMPRAIKVYPPPEAPEDCPERHLQQAQWQDFHRYQSGALPHSTRYAHIVIEPGGADARRSRKAWASWTQVWPAPTGGGAGGASGFDVSDVDLTNIPNPDCDEEFGSDVWNSCMSWKQFPDIGIAGARWDGINTSYVQIKNASDGEEELEALRLQLVPDYRDYGNEVEIIPVKYDFGELWRWSVILDRFAFSAGNTIGIVGGEVSINSPFYSERPRHLWMNGVEPAGWDEWDADLDGEEVREILIVWTYDHELAADALPELLPELGIPVDAVGLVLGRSASFRVERSTSSVDASESTVTVSTNASETAASQTAPIPDTDGESEPRTVPAAAAGSSDTDTSSSVTPMASHDDQDNSAAPDQQSISPADSSDRSSSAPKATASDTDRRDTRDLNRLTAGEVTSSGSTNSRWVLMGVAGAVILALAVSAILLGVRLARRCA